MGRKNEKLLSQVFLSTRTVTDNTTFNKATNKKVCPKVFEYIIIFNKTRKF